jgi:DNA-directed RNA polymerase II subunit RPB1
MTIEQIEDKIVEHFQDQLNILRSDINDPQQVMRVRFVKRGDDTLGPMELKQTQERLLNDLALKGFKEIKKVYRTKYKDHEFDSKGAYLEPPAKLSEVKTYFLETDGVALAKVFTIPEVDHTRTISNSLIENLRVLGIEAVRKTLIKELRVVLDVYGIYVNYRHLATLCDVMTHRGILTSITRHGINRVDTGPLRKASFEETVEILYEAAVFHEIDNLKGITENIIMGQLAPFGTGYFDLVLDTSMLAPERDNDGENSSDNASQLVDYNFLTPEQVADSPQIQTGASERESVYGGNSVH